MYKPFDMVNYHGFKFKELKSKLGEVVAVVPSSGAIVVDFGLENAYLLSEASLALWHPSAKELLEAAAKESGKEVPEVVVQKKRRRVVGDEE